MRQELSLDDMKKIELSILKKFDEICKENNIEYSLAYGTMLGAVRHHGFIPWDDDIDVYMKRDQYEKLLSLMYCDNKYEIKSHRYSKEYYYPFAKMVDKTTEINEPWRADKNMGLYIDIFPLDICSEPIDKKWLRKCQRYVNIAYLMGHKLSHHKSLSPRYAVKLLFLLVTYPFKKNLIKKADRLCSSQKNGGYYSMLVQMTAIDDFIKREKLSGVEYIDFEDEKFPVYKEYDYLLTKQYGDYMTPPPLEEQISNHYFKAYMK